MMTQPLKNRSVQILVPYINETKMSATVFLKLNNDTDYVSVMSVN